MRFYQKQWFMWISIIFFAPLGIFLCWKYKFYDEASRVVLTILSGLFFIIFSMVIVITVVGDIDYKTRYMPQTENIAKETPTATPQPIQAEQVKQYADNHMGINLGEFCDIVVNDLKLDFDEVPQITDEWRGDDDRGYTTYKMSFKDGSKLSITTQDSKLCSVDYYGEDGKNKK